MALRDVPDGVRDVLRRRLARLPPPAVAVLRLAAVAGHDTDAEVLIDAADAGESEVLDALDAGLVSGLLTEPAPGRVRFVHALVRDTVATDLSQIRRTRMHARLAAALERLHPGDVSALAHHYSGAATAATAAKAVGYCVRAAALADERYAHDTAVELLGRALERFERVPPAELRDRDAEHVELLGALLRAQVRAGAVPAARATRSAALEVAERARRDDLLVAAFTAWTEPTPWQTRPFGIVDERIVALVSRLLARPDLQPAVRCRLLAVHADEISGEVSRGSLLAAREAAGLAGELADPRLRALTAATLVRELIQGDQDEVARLAGELRELGTEHDLPAFRWAGMFNLARVTARRGEAAGARRLVTEALALARDYRMPEPTGVSECALAAFAHLEGRPEEAERRYATTTDRMTREGSLHSAFLMFLARATLLATGDRLAELAPYADEFAELYGRSSADVAAAALAAAGRDDEARRVLARSGLPLHPTFFTVFATFRAHAVVALKDREAAQELYDALLPHRDTPPAGMENLALSMWPVAHTLGELAVLLGRDRRAAGHFTRAVAVTGYWNAPLWNARARAALEATGRPGRAGTGHG